MIVPSICRVLCRSEDSTQQHSHSTVNICANLRCLQICILKKTLLCKREREREREREKREEADDDVPATALAGCMDHDLSEPIVADKLPTTFVLSSAKPLSEPNTATFSAFVRRGLDTAASF